MMQSEKAIYLYLNWFLVNNIYIDFSILERYTVRQEGSKTKMGVCC